MSIASLGYVIFETTAPDRWERFLTNTVGLATATGPGSGDYYRMDDAAWRINVQKGTQERFLTAGFELASPAQLDACVERISRSGAPIEEDTALAAERGVKRLFRAKDPCGNLLELFLGRTRSYELFVSPAGVSGFVTGDHGEMGLGHIVLPTPDVEAAKRFWLDVVGLRLTDEMTFVLSEEIGPQKLYFLHADNARHHSLALFEAPAPAGLIHFMLEVPTIDDVGHFIDRCERDEVHIASQFGRHSNDRMLSTYAVTPGSFLLEFGCDGLQIDWRNWVATTSLVPDVWGHKFTG